MNKQCKWLFGLILILLLPGCQWLKAKKDYYVLVFEERNGVEVTARHDDYSEHEVFLDSAIPVSYQIRNSNHVFFLNLRLDYLMSPVFNMQAVNERTGEYYYIKTDKHPQDCYWIGKRAVTFSLNPKEGFQFKHEKYSEGSGHPCRKILESGETQWVEFQFYDSNRQLVATENLAYRFVKNGYYLYK